MSTVSFNIIYDGPALTNHEMEVRELASALIAFGDLFEEANETINKGRSKIAVSVKGSFKTGSFKIDMSVAQSLLQYSKDILLGDNITAALALAGLVGFVNTVGQGVLYLVKWIRGRNITKVELLANDIVKIYCDKDCYESELKILELYRNYRIRKALQNVIYTPLQREGIDFFAVCDEAGKKFVEVTREESAYFVAPDFDEEIIGSLTRNATLQIVSVSFREDNKWRFSDGNSTFHASIADRDFLKRVESNEERFGKGDILSVSLFETQTLKGDQLKSDITIEKVLEHRRASVQLKLPITHPDVE